MVTWTAFCLRYSDQETLNGRLGHNVCGPDVVQSGFHFSSLKTKNISVPTWSFDNRDLQFPISLITSTVIGTHLRGSRLLCSSLDLNHFDNLRIPARLVEAQDTTSHSRNACLNLHVCDIPEA